ncbi:MAG: MFS transporter [Actinomycetota bacterium]
MSDDAAGHDLRRVRFPLRRLVASGPALGDTNASRLLPVHVFHSAGETMFAISLAGSLFFNVSLDAARPRILLYLALTMAPFVVLAPLVGPFIDRVRGGHRVVLMTALGGRALVAVLLASQLRSLLLYPFAFAILVLAKIYSVSRNSLVPVLVDERDHLVVVNSRLARDGTIAGAVTSPIGVLILNTGGADWVLRTGAVLYLIGTLLALRIPAPQVASTAGSVVESTELTGPGVRTALAGMATLRSAAGFVFFHVGFVLKQEGEPLWVFGLVAGAGAVGGFVGTFVAPWLRRRVDEQMMLTMALALPGALAVVAALRFHRISIVAFALALGLAGSVARRAFDGVVQTEAPHARRGKAYAGLETRIEIGWVIGALLAVVSRAPDWAGLAVLAVWLLSITGDRWWSARAAARLDAEVGARTLPIRLIETAESLAARGDRQQAAVLAVAAAETAREQSDIDDGDAEEIIERLRALGHAVVDDTEPADDRADDTVQALSDARELVDRYIAPGREEPVDRSA